MQNPGRFLCALLLIAILGFVSACGESSSTGPEEEPELEGGSMSARIDGTAWSATAAMAVSYTGGILAFAGSDASSITVGVGLIPDGTGTYTIGPSQTTNANLSMGTPASWGATGFMGSGSVTLASISENRATGTFLFTAEPVPGTGATGSRVVTEGKFDVNF